MREAAARILERPPAGWGALLDEDPNATPSHRPELWDAWCAVTPGHRPCFVAVERAGALIGGVPLVVERRLGFSWIHALPLLLSGAPLAAPEARAVTDQAVGAAIARLQSELGVVGGEWALYRADREGAAPAALETVRGETRMLETFVLELGSGPERLERRFAPDVRQALRRGASTLDFAEEPEAIEAVHALHSVQARAWRAHRPIPIELARRLLGAGGRETPVARLFTAREARRLVAGIYFLDHRRELFAWWSGARPDAVALHAMPFLYARVAQWAEAAGRARLNLGGTGGVAGLGGFKRSLGGRAVSYPVRWLDPAPHATLARAFRELQDRARRGRFRGAPL